MRRALIVEDNHLISMMIADELSDQGYAIIDVATSQAQAVELATANCPDLITVDDTLDSGTGVDTIREICRERAIPAIFITANPETITKAHPEAIIVSKPFASAQLAEAIGTALMSPTLFPASD